MNGLTIGQLIEIRRSMREAVEACNSSLRPVVALDPHRWTSDEELAASAESDSAWYNFIEPDHHDNLLLPKQIGLHSEDFKN